MSVYEDTLQGLQEALDYVRGDKTKGHSIIVTIPDDEIEFNQIVFQKLQKLSEQNRQKAMSYIDELLMASNQ